MLIGCKLEGMDEVEVGKEFIGTRRDKGIFDVTIGAKEDGQGRTKEEEEGGE